MGIAVFSDLNRGTRLSYLLNTPDDEKTMLQSIGVQSIDELFASIPANLRLNRPLDDQSQPRIHREAEAVITLLEQIAAHTLECAFSEIAAVDIDANRDPERPRRVRGFLPDDVDQRMLNDGVLARARVLRAAGMASADALHVGLADWCVSHDQIAELDRCLDHMSWSVHPQEALRTLVATFGREEVLTYANALQAYSERLTRAALEKLPDGEWSFEDWIDDDGVDYGKPIRLFVTFRKTGDRLVADWTGTSPQVKGAINNTASFTRAATYTCLKSVLSHDVLCNAGFYRAIDVIAPPGSIANGVLPAASAARGLTGFRMIDTCFGALAQMLPARSIAATEGGNTGVSIGGYYPDRTPFIFVEFICSAWGGRAWADGLDGNVHPFFGRLSGKQWGETQYKHVDHHLRQFGV